MKDETQRSELVLSLSIKALTHMRDGEGDCDSPLHGMTYRQLLSELIRNNRQVFLEEKPRTAQELRKAFTRKPCAKLMALNQQREAGKQVISAIAGLSANS